CRLRRIESRREDKTMIQALLSRASHAAALVALLCAGCASEPKPIIERTTVISDTATVRAIDVPTRQLTLKSSDGRTATWDVDEQVKNLQQMKVGDQVVVDYIEGVAVYIVKPGTSPSVSSEQAADVAKPGEKPSIAGAHRITLVGVIEAIDENAPSVTLRGA